ncbi:MAG: alpha/beta hydrolase [Acidimicrobiales bacterium]
MPSWLRAPRTPVLLAVTVLLSCLAAASVSMAGMVRASAQAVGGVKTTRDVSYSQASPLDVLNIVQPAASGQDRNAIILIHGGGYTSGANGELEPESIAFAQAGWVAFNIDYGFNGYPAETDDAFAAVKWVRANAAAYGVDPSRIGVLGSSAGGTLAGMIATEGAAQGAAVSAVATWSGPMDLGALVDGSRVGSYTYVHPVQYVGGCLPSACDATYAAASPLDHVTSSTSPMLIANSTNEIIPLTQAQDMDNALMAAGVPQELDVIPGNRHASAYASVELAPTMAFLTKYVAANPVGTTPPTAVTTTTAPTTTTGVHGAPAVAQPSSHVKTEFLVALLVVLLIALLIIFLVYRSGRSGRRRA